jgi:acid stress-induced BolA-like protein IbaG/YrbA
MTKNVQEIQDSGNFRFGYISESMPNSEKVVKQKVSQMSRCDQKNVRKSQDGGHFRFGYISESMPNSEKVMKTKIVPNDKIC